MFTKLDRNIAGRAGHLFDGWDETLIWSCLDGEMGDIYADNAEHPLAAAAFIGDLLFLAGDSECPAAPELARAVAGLAPRPWVLAIPQNERWARIIEEAWGARASRTTRFATYKDASGFDAAQLRRNIDALSKQYVLTGIGPEQYEFTRSKAGEWAYDFCSQFGGADDYAARGLGVMALYGGRRVPIGGASSYTVYNGSHGMGIEIEIQTIAEHRRRGVALACASKLILDCLERGLYPSWDAANPGSLALAQKLGYRFSHEYVTYIVRP